MVVADLAMVVVLVGNLGCLHQTEQFTDMLLSVEIHF